TDFCVRSGLVLADMPAFQAARKRVLGSGVDEKAAAEAAAQAALEEAGAGEALEEIGATAHENEPTEAPTDDEDVGADAKEKGPVAVAIRFRPLLRQSERKSLSKNRNVSNALQTQAKKLLEKKA